MGTGTFSGPCQPWKGHQNLEESSDPGEEKNAVLRHETGKERNFDALVRSDTEDRFIV